MLEGVTEYPFYQILDYVLKSTNNNILFKSFNEEKSWIQTICLSLKIMPEKDLASFNISIREKNHMNAVKKFSSKGVKFDLKEDDIHFSADDKN
ncbi:MAG: hypothetical protein FWH29_09385 [Methanobrevibacter sp.]|nr:hypothetical protein [Methanobrevibacter sp.]